MKHTPKPPATQPPSDDDDDDDDDASRHYGGAAGSKGATAVADTMDITATVTGTTTMTRMTTTDLAYHWTHGKNRRLRPFPTVREGA